MIHAKHHNDAIMGAVASQITSLTIVYSTALNKENIKAQHLSGLCAGNSAVTSEFPAQMASNAENVSIWWCHHDIKIQMQLRCVLGTLTSKVTLFTIPHIHPPHHDHPKGHPFCSKSIGPPICEIRLFQNFTLKIQGQDHGCGQRARSHSRISIQMICLIFISYQTDQQFLI